MVLPLLCLLAALLLPGAHSEERSIPAECHPQLYTHYDELGCTPVFGSGPCPIKYDCSAISSRSSDKCYVGGTQYEPGASIGSFFRSCSAACFCQQLEQNRTKVTCAQVECPEFFNPAFRQPGCILQYSIDSCCSKSQFCPNATKNTTDTTCEYKGSILMEGQKFYPDEEPCKVCVCQEGFDGTFREPWCKKISCGTELHHDDDIQDGCVPVYYSGCCPISYRCPEAGDQVRSVSPEDGADARVGADKCIYGSLEMNVGDALDLGDDSCTTCDCRTPPFITCEKKCSQ